MPQNGGAVLKTECAQVAQDILDGKYGKYQVADRWDAAFDWDNDACDEVIFGFPGAPGYSHWQYDAFAFSKHCI